MTGLLHQAGCVAIGGRGVLIEGPPGIGKSSLALALIDRGAMLVGDDGILLETDTGVLIASPAPATAGLMEVRNLGIVSMTCMSRVPVALLIQLDHEAPRYRDEADRVTRNGITVPSVSLWPDSPALALRTELALKLFGVP